MSCVDPGEGWRLLEGNERVAQGDEAQWAIDLWLPVSHEVGFIVSLFGRSVRRRVPAATADAHPWCRDVDRDEAIRADEDAAKLTLPEWRELPGIVADQVRTIANVLDVLGETCARVAALESAAKAAPAANADAEANAPHQQATALVTAQRECWEKCVGVVCDGGSLGRDIGLGDVGAGIYWADSEITRLTAERDAAIRERDEARVQIGRLDAELLSLSQGNDELFAERKSLMARVAELEAASEAGTVRVGMWVSYRLDQDGGRECAFDGYSLPSWKQHVTLDLTPSQVRDIERQVSGEVGRG